MSRLLQQNLAALSIHQPQMAQRIQHSISDTALIPIKTQAGIPSLAMQSHTGMKLLHSQYDPWSEAKRLLGSKNAATIIVFGSGAAFIPRQALQNTVEVSLQWTHKVLCSVIIVDRSAATWRRVLEHIDIQHELQSGNLRLADSVHEAVAQLPHIHHSMLAKSIQCVSLTAWTIHNKKFFQQCSEGIHKWIRADTQELYTVQNFGKRWLIQTVYNSLKIRTQETITAPYTCIFQKQVIIAAAGPSLDNWITHYNAEQNSAVIIAADTALPALLSAHIIPEIVMCIDPQPWSILHFTNIRELSHKTLLVADLGIHPAITARAHRILFLASPHPLHQYFAAQCVSLSQAYTSVTEAALLFAAHHGAKSIQLVGVDGGYARAVSYARGTYYRRKALHTAHRLQPLPNTISASIYKNSTIQAARKNTQQIFFSHKALQETKTRLTRLHSHVSAPTSASIPAAPKTQPIHICTFWQNHIQELQQIHLHQPLSSAHTIHALGHHGRAHLPFFAYQRFHNNAANIDDIIVFLLAILHRYCM